jgi:transposase-like protein
MMKDESKRRKAARLSAKNRALISEVDLKEPHLRVEDAIFEATFERDLENHRGDVVSTVHEKLLKGYTDVPVIFPERPTKSQPEPPVLEEEPEPVPPVSESPSKRKRMPAETRQEIADAYVAGMSVDDICSAWSIGVGSLYSTLNKLKIPRRTRYPGGQTLEHLDPIPESHAVSAPTPGNGTSAGLPEWLVTIEVRRTEVIAVHAQDFNAAAAAALLGMTGDTQVVSIARAR